MTRSEVQVPHRPPIAEDLFCLALILFSAYSAYTTAMAHDPAKGISLWNETTGAGKHQYPKLEKDFSIDVAVIGGGIAGLTLAYLLKKAGKKVAVFEKHSIGQGVTGFTTAKVTSQHGLVYSELFKNFDETTAQLYGEANQQAIDTIETII